jgi:hypothetical protein
VSVADFAESGRNSYAAELDEQARRKGVRPIASVDELRADVFDLEKFRHQHMA